MSREISNARLSKIAMGLPGRDEDNTDTARGYVGWGPDEDSMCGSRSVEHEDWASALGAINNPAREIHDFYFVCDEPSESCACCVGSGINKDYAELQRGFYPNSGTGRWARWSRNLHQDEIDALIAKGRIRPKKGEAVTPDNLARFLGPFGHDEINRWILTPIRAKRLGISTTECFECVGTGRVPTGPMQIQLNIWSFLPMEGSSRTDSVLNVTEAELPEVQAYLAEIGWEGVQRRFGWATGHNQYSEIRTDEAFRQQDNRPRYAAWDRMTHETYANFDDFIRNYGGGNIDLNLVFDYRVHAAAEHFDDNPFASSELPEAFSLEIVMTHPRKGSDKVIRVENCAREDGEALKAYLRKSYDIHGRHFAWAAGREFGNEAVREAETEPNTDSMSFFTGR